MRFAIFMGLMCIADAIGKYSGKEEDKKTVQGMGVLAIIMLGMDAVEWVVIIFK